MRTAKAYVYWNLHKQCFSVKHRGAVVAHATRILAKRAEFRVSETGRQRVLAQGRKNVHAYIVCDVEDLYCDGAQGIYARADVLTWPIETNVLATNAQEYGTQIRYNPYDGDSFTVASNGRPVTSAATVCGVCSLRLNRAALWAERFA